MMIRQKPLMFGALPLLLVLDCCMEFTVHQHPVSAFCPLTALPSPRSHYYDYLPTRHPTRSTTYSATVVPQESLNLQHHQDQTNKILQHMSSTAKEAKEYADQFGLTHTEAAIYALFTAIRNAKIPLGLQGEPFVLRRHDIIRALDVEEAPFDHFFTLDDLAQAVQDDFLDAARGSTDNRKGWKITGVSTPRGDSFEDARMTFDEVQDALDKGTVIINAAGAHIPKLAGPSLACTDATSLPNAINLYVTAAGKRTSAPPHTDKQDVVVLQTCGQKHWRVFAPTNASLKPHVDMFARGKGDDSLPLHALLDESSPNSSKLLMETVLNEGDVLFVPAAFPHTTSTAHNSDDNKPDAATSVHLTFNIDTHIWELDYLSARRLALRRACVVDTALGQPRDDDNRYEGKVNQLDESIRKELFRALPLGLLDDTTDDNKEDVHQLIEQTAVELQRISTAVDPETASLVDPRVWRDTVERVRQQGMELLEIHRKMYVAAMEEGRIREAEDAMTAHLDDSVRRKAVMTPERIQRLSVFRVKHYYEQIDASKQSLLEWSYAGKPSATAAATTITEGDDPEVTAPSLPGRAAVLPENWAFTLPVQKGDHVEADLGGAFFDATVTRVVAGGNKFDVQFFDGDVETGLDRSQIKLKKPPVLEEDSTDAVDTSEMTPKQLKRWKKEQEKKKKKQ